MNKKDFYREDYTSFKKKYALLCETQPLKVNKFGDLENKNYISRINITEK